jgi:hypothetical protein
MPNVTNKSLLAAGVDPDLWDRAKKICNSPAYKTKRAPHRAEGGPFATDITGEPIWLDDPKTGPIRVGDAYGQYTRVTNAESRGGRWYWGIVTWVKLQ